MKVAVSINKIWCTFPIVLSLIFIRELAYSNTHPTDNTRYSDSQIISSFHSSNKVQSEIFDVIEFDSVQIRKVNLFFGLGCFEFAVIGFGFQLSDSWSIAVKGSCVLIPGIFFIGPPAGDGIGIKISRYFSEIMVLEDLLCFDTINIEMSLLLNTFNYYLPRVGIHGFAFELTAGHECKYNSIINYYWAIGGGLSAAKKENGPFIFPSFKLGLNFNF